MSNIKSNHPEIPSTSVSTDRTPVTGTYNSVSDKMSQDVNITGSFELRDIVQVLNKINVNLEKLLIMVGEISDISGDEL